MEFNSEERKASLLPPLRLNLSPLSLQFKDSTMKKIAIDDMIKHSTLDKQIFFFRGNLDKINNPIFTVQSPQFSLFSSI